MSIKIFMRIGNRIKKLRTDANLTQEKFAELINTNKKMLSHYETSRTIPPLEILKKISKHFRISLDFIIFGEDKDLAEKFKIKDPKLLELFRRVNDLNKNKRSQISWSIEAFLEKEQRDSKR